MSNKPRLVVLISGGGTNLQALIDAIGQKKLAAEIVGVVSSRSDAYGLQRAREAGIPAVVLSPRAYTDRESFDADLYDIVSNMQPDLVILAGFLRILGPKFLDRFPRSVINLHPALPGQFAGMHAIERAFEAYQAGRITHSGCMVHYVIAEVDAGPVIEQRRVDFLPDDTLEAFATRLHAYEHELIVSATRTALARLKF